MNKNPKEKEKVKLSNVEICHQIAQSLCELHSMNIIHCDLIPENIFFFKEESRFKIGNFHKAETLKHCEGTFIDEKCKNHFGLYRSPEVIDMLEHSKASDVFSLGVIFFRLLSNKESDLSIDGKSFGKCIYLKNIDKLQEYIRMKDQVLK